MPKILQHAHLEYDAYGLPSNFHDHENGRLTTRTIDKAIGEMSYALAPRRINQQYHIFHHPKKRHVNISNLNLRPYHINQQRIVTDYCIYFVNTSKFTTDQTPRSKLFSAERIRRLENIIFGNVTSKQTYLKLKQLLNDVGSFHLILIQKVHSSEDVNPSLRDFLPRDRTSLNVCNKVKYSVPSSWEFFKMTSFSKDFFKSGDLDSGCCRLCHALGVFDVHRLVGSIGQLKKSSKGENIEYLSKREFTFNTNVAEKLK